MLTTNQAFEKFRKNLELSPTEQKDAERRHSDVRDCIRGGFDIKADFLSGSYRRHTKTKPLKDVDVVFVLGEDEKWRRDKAPVEVLQAFQGRLQTAYTERDQVTIGRRAVTVEFEKKYYPESHDGKVLSIDAVPAFECGRDYEIPDKTTGTWIKTNPETHKAQATAKNKQLDECWVPLVKMIKGWNRANKKPIKPSFLIEVMAEELIEGPFSTYPDEIRNFFSAAETNIARQWPDPASLGPLVSDQMTPELIARAKIALREAQNNMLLASRLAATNRQGEALRTWREVLGDYFPLS